MSGEPTGLQTERVLDRDGSAAGFFGLTFGEAGILLGTAWVCAILDLGPILSLCLLALAYVYLVKIKRVLPDHFLGHLWDWLTKKHHHYRASGPDVHARSYLRPE